MQTLFYKIGRFSALTRLLILRLRYYYKYDHRADKAGCAYRQNDSCILVKAKAHSDANLVTAKAYTDAEIAKIHGVDNKTIKLAENKAYVAEVSTDILTQGT